MNKLVLTLLAALLMLGTTLPGMAAVSDANKAAVIAAAKNNQPSTLKAKLSSLLAGKTEAEAKAIASELIQALLADSAVSANAALLADSVALLSAALVVTSGANAEAVVAQVATQVSGNNNALNAAFNGINSVTGNNQDLADYVVGLMATYQISSGDLGTGLAEETVTVLLGNPPAGTGYEGQDS